MNITRAAVTKAVAECLVNIAKQYEIVNVEFIRDIYLVFKNHGKGLKSDEDLDREILAETGKDQSIYWIKKHQAATQKMFLEDFTTYDWFQMNSRLPPLEATEETVKMLHASAQLWMKLLPLLQNLPMGQQPPQAKMGQPTQDNILSWGFSMLNFWEHPVFGGGEDKHEGGENPYYNVTEDAVRKWNKSVLDAAQNLSSRDLEIFRLAQILEAEICKKGAGKKEESEVPKQVEVGMAGFEGATKALPSQHVDDDYFDKRAAVKELGIRIYEMPREKAQLLYVLLDVSASMKDAVVVNWPKSHIASAFCLALLSKVMDRQDIFYLQPFSGSPGKLTVAENNKSARAVSDWLRKCGFNGGGTDIRASLLTAAENIKAAKDKLGGADVLLITDGEDMRVDAAEIKKVLGKTKLHVLRIGSFPQPNFLEMCKQANTYLNTEFKDGVLELVNLGRKL